MNHSRLSYTIPLESSNEYSVDVILHKCEFCQRTFIPDSLKKHRKVCYRDFLKKRSVISNINAKTLWRSKSEKDVTGMTMTDLMVSRKFRRMNWRGRHEQFIQTIRAARDSSSLLNNGENSSEDRPSLSTSTNNLDNSNRELLKQCKHCLRKFNKDAILKHLVSCKEHSIQSNRLRPNSAQIEAKRRMSLRLYYKPKSFRGDSPEDDLTTSMSSRDLDCQSTATLYSENIPNDLTRVSPLTTSILNLRKGAEGAVKTNLKNGALIPKSNKFIKMQKFQQPRRESEKRITHITSVERRKPPSFSSNNVNKKLNRSQSIVSDTKVSVKNGNIEKNSSNSRKISMDQKLKVISKMLKDNEPESVKNNEVLIDNGSNPANSFNKAKEVIEYLNIRIKENELINEARSNLEEVLNKENNIDSAVGMKNGSLDIECCPSNDENKKIKEEDCFEDNNMDGFDLCSLLDKINSPQNEIKSHSVVETNGITDNIVASGGVTLGTVGRLQGSSSRQETTSISLLTKKEYLSHQAPYNFDAEYSRLWNK